MMKRTMIFAALAAIALTACEQKLELPEEYLNPGGQESSGLVFEATTESPETKTALEKDGDDYNVAWRDGDRITIVDAGSHAGVYTTTSTTTQGSFTYVPESGSEAVAAPYKAWYPASIYNNGAPELPATQEYVEGNIAGSPMFAGSATTSLSFKNLAGILCLNLSTGMSDITVGSISLSAEQPMSGPITNVASLSSDTPVAATVSGSAGVTLDCGAGVAINSTPKPFYFAVPAGSYTGLAITVTTTGGAYQTFSLKADRTIVVGRSQITSINLTANNILYDLPASYSPAEYLASDGTQYIDTGVPCDWQDFVDIDFMYTGREPGNVHPSEGGSVFGAHGWSKANGIYEKCIYWRGFGKIAYSFALNTQYNVKTVDGTHSSINGVTYQIDVTNNVGVAPCNFALFANYSDYNSQGWTYFSVARIYSCKLYDSNHMWLRYFVPCVRTADGKPGMFDRVTGAFYTNSGTGEFSANLIPTIYDLTGGNVTVPEATSAKVTGTNADAVLTIGAGATVTLEDATCRQIITQGDATLILNGANVVAPITVDRFNAIIPADNSTLTIGGTGSLDCSRWTSGTMNYCINNSTVDLVIEGGVLTFNSSRYRSPSAVVVNNYRQTGGTVSISVSSNNSDGDRYPEGLYAWGNISISGGSLTSNGSIAVYAKGDMTISGGTVNATGDYRHYYGSSGLTALGTLTISGGTVTAAGSGGAVTGPGIGSVSTCGDIVISGGTVTATGNNSYGANGSAGIGTGSGGGTCGNITITSGITRLVVTKASSAQAPIGNGNPNGTVGTITIDGVVNPTAESFFENLNLEVSNSGNTWTLTPRTIVDLASVTSEYTAQDGEVITGTLGSIVQINVAAGASIVLKDATINGVGHDTYYAWSGLNCLGDATITLVGTNTVRGFNNKFPGINVPFGNDLIIRGTGSLHASTNGWGAGIGGGQNISCGNIRIEGGDITAVGGEHSAGIGGGWTGNAGQCGNIVITGGTIHATGYEGAAGIGAGSNSKCGDIIISGGDITAIGGIYAAGIGSSAGNSPTIGACGNISITGGTIHATGGNASAGIGGGYYCGTIDITDGVTEIIATKGAGAPNSIGAGQNAICGTVTIAAGANVTQN